ncbi:beta-lactamase regulating signal transducer with metallopeptidase domain/predicted nucleic acid-binding Zn-ribbon protein [Lysobacter niastensis]|uniref:Beta-lactamase regulating signal transducer with metallopeptidase domain/predicted nucleic acid-binding Zn-ribbon protein n=1 Tax=Lysobacter niastensis TaxID=380629 RepID=A0ABU1WF55_9GAMM|nr:M56 family metallopeptidase [Lysobacter niastensis]MDR7136007.1 beta-lactamase regulating signal transducer with metallopeptidase domain/predicted nucleic acid-binding Zn-ribbon protein [Lysobacter niastensis]
MTDLSMTELMQALVPVLGRALLHFLWQGAIIGLLAAAALQLLRNALPQTRYAVACAALLACLLAPAMYIVAHIGITPDVVVPASMAAPAVFTALVAQPAPSIDAWSIRLDSGLPFIVALWAAGACVLSLRMAMGVAWLGRLRATPQGPAHAAWQARLDALCGVLGLHRPVALRLVDAIDSPASAGWWRPVVLLPTALIARMPHELIEALLAHELAHIRRHDYLVNLMQGVVEALLFYHPVTWWLSRQIRNEREHIADGLAVEATGEPRRLALALSELSELLSQPNQSKAHHTSFHLAQAAHGGHLMSRIEKLVRPDRKSNGGRLAFPVLGLAAACLAFYAHAQVTKPAVITPAVVAPATVKPSAAQYSQAVAKAGSGNTIRLRDDSPQDAYALIRKGQHGFTMSGSSDDIDEIRAAQHSLSEDFIWFRRADKAYVIVDPAIVARAQAAWRDSDKLGASMEALGQQMETHGDKMEAIGEQMERLSEQHGQSAAMEVASQRMEAFGKQQAALGAKQAALAASMATGDEAQQRSLDRQMDALSRQQDALARQMDEQARVLDAESDRIEAQMKPMEALSRQMEEASKPMDALGKQMDTLGKQQEKLVEQAERETQKLISEAMAQGLARPVPGSTKR